MTKIRVGLGFDTHAFQKGEYLMIGGVKVLYIKSFKAHSDGDVLYHAICDALLGAAGLKDIGTYFPDNNSTYKSINSALLLEKVVQMIHSMGWKVSNIDCNIIIQEPKMAPYIDDMKVNISSLLQINIEDVSVKAKTSEMLGFIGRSEGVSTQVVVLIMD